MVLIRISAGILELETLASWVLKRSLPWFVLQLRAVTYDCMQSDDSLQHDDGEYRRAALKPMAVWRLASGAHFWLRQYACFGRTAKKWKQTAAYYCLCSFFLFESQNSGKHTRPKDPRQNRTTLFDKRTKRSSCEQIGFRSLNFIRVRLEFAQSSTSSDRSNWLRSPDKIQNSQIRFGNSSPLLPSKFLCSQSLRFIFRLCVFLFTGDLMQQLWFEHL